MSSAGQFSMSPDGAPDGHFWLALMLPEPTEIASVALYSADADGNPAGGQVWHSRNSSYYVLGVHSDGKRLNDTHVATLGIHQGRVAFDLYAANSGWFTPGRTFLAEVIFADGSRATQLAALPR